jgi:hypothetical protein
MYVIQLQHVTHSAREIGHLGVTRKTRGMRGKRRHDDGKEVNV